MTKLLPLILLLISSASLADEITPASPWYEVEIVIFTHSDATEHTLENFSQQAATPQLIEAIELIPPFLPADEESPAVEAAYQWLNAEQLTLQPQLERLTKRDSYQILQHLGWRQPGLEKEVAPAILIYPYDQSRQLSLERYQPLAAAPQPALAEEIPELEQPPAAGLADNSAIIPMGDAQLAELAAISVPEEQDTIAVEGLTDDWQHQPHVIGAIRLILSRYLHIESDLLLTVPTEQVITADQLSLGFMTPAYTDYASLPPSEISYLQQPEAIPLTEHHYYRIEEKRRVRKGELHYFDHPQFGMLLEVRDYQAPEEPSDEEEPSSTEESDKR